MSTSTVFAKDLTTLEGTDELTINVKDITTANSLARQVLDLGEQAKRITGIHVDISGYFDTIEEAERPTFAAQEELDISESKDIVGSPSPVPSVNTDQLALCTPLIAILNSIKSQRGGLKSFSWPAEHYTTRKFTRPPTFWTALYAHASTLESLHIDFFCHEVHEVAPLPSDTRFPVLKRLQLDATSAHGDDGTSIDALLHASPGLEVLHFDWPLCDLDTCQIQKISWGWTFPKLTRLFVFGCNFAPAAYSDFLERHSGITSLEEKVDGPWIPCGDGDGFVYAQAHLPVTAVPKLQELRKDFTYTHDLCSYFDPAVNRPIRTLAVSLPYHNDTQDLLKIAEMSTAQETIRSLELIYDIESWRHHVQGSIGNDVETESPSEDKSIKRRVQNNSKSANSQRRANILTHVLSLLKSLEELTIDMDSSRVGTCSSTGEWIYPNAMNIDDVKQVLTLLPKSKDSKLKLLRMKDSRAKDSEVEKLQEYLDERKLVLGRCEAVLGSLEVLEWCGDETRVLELQ